jgi:trk system potassium uptake protein TrkA
MPENNMSQHTDSTPEDRDGPDGTTRQPYAVLGGGDVGASIATQLVADGDEVTFVDEDCAETAENGVAGDPSDVAVLRGAGLADVATVVVATLRDKRNLLIAQIVKTHFDVTEVFVFVNRPDRSDIVVETGHSPICVSTEISAAVVGRLREHDERRYA